MIVVKLRDFYLCNRVVLNARYMQLSDTVTLAIV